MAETSSVHVWMIRNIHVKKSELLTICFLPGPPGIIPCGGGPIMGIMGGPPMGGVGSMPGRGGPPELETANADFWSMLRHNYSPLYWHWTIKSQRLCFGSLIKSEQSWKTVDSPGGGPPGKGVGGIFPCWKAAAVGRKDKHWEKNNQTSAAPS